MKDNEVEIDQYVGKVGGDYTFIGHVRSVFTKKSGVVRVVVENDMGLLFIFNPGQLTYYGKDKC